jgi:hypothetical protein
VVQELYDVVVLPGVRRPMALGFKTDEIRRVVSVGTRRPVSLHSGLRAALDPRSVAVIGASDNPHKVGGRPILYLQRHGFKGAIYPINPARTSVQSLKSYPEIGATPEAPELAIVAVAGDEALAAVEACAARAA